MLTNSDNIRFDLRDRNSRSAGLFAFIMAFAVIAGGLTGCTATRFLAEDEEFYAGHSIKVEAENRIPSKSSLKRELEEVVRPDPTPSLFGVSRPRVWLYYAMGTPGTGVGRWIKNRLGREPVLFDRVSPDHTSLLLTNRLHNNGFFDGYVEYEVKRKRKSATVRYNVFPRNPYFINRLSFPRSGNMTDLESEITASLDNTLLKEGSIYNLSKLRAERERIDDALKESGFFYFNPDFLIFYADTTVRPHTVDLSLGIKPDIPGRAARRYSIGNVFLFPDYDLERDTAREHADTLVYNGLSVITRDHRIKTDVLIRSVYLRTGEIYERQNRVMTISRLMGLGLFKFANITFHDAGEGVLDANVYLTPLEERSMRVELQAVSKSNDFAGPGLNAQYRNRNFRRSAEQLSLNLTSGFETQIGGQSRGLDSFELGIDVELLIPRIVSPIRFYESSGIYVPRTRLKAGYQMLNRVDLFYLNSFNASFGYIWNISSRTRYQYTPVNVNYIRSGGMSEEFERQLALFPMLRRSFEEQFIIGSLFSYYYNTQVDDWRRNHLYFNANLDLSGNLLYGINSLLRTGSPDPEDPYKLFGIAFSQYAKADLDFRYYYPLGAQSRLVTRIIGGVGVPFGNSNTMPYVKQFFIGGTNSVRAFAARSIGPGAYRPSEEDGRLFIDRTGDIRIETNIEYRFPIVSILKGALFLDAGNIWMIRDDKEREGALFDPDTFLSEFAVGTGLGVRLDASFFVLRLDVAFPLRKPYLPAGERWVVDDIKFGSSRWRKDNLTFNIAIGYPF